MRQVNLRLSEDLYARVERARGEVARNRWLTVAAEARLDGERTEQTAPRAPARTPEPTTALPDWAKPMLESVADRSTSAPASALLRSLIRDVARESGSDPARLEAPGSFRAELQRRLPDVDSSHVQQLWREYACGS